VRRSRLDPARRLVTAAAVGYGQVLFCESALGGGLLLAATAIVAPGTAGMAAVACLLSTLVAHLRCYPAVEWRRGLYGYAAALFGLFAGALFPPSAKTWLVLLAAAAVAPAITHLAHRLLTPREIPALALPALALTWCAILVLGIAAPPAEASAGQLGIAFVVALAGLGLYSRLAALAAGLGVAIGLVLATASAAALAPVILSNTVPTAMALAAVLVPWSVASAGLATVGAVAAGALATALVGLGVPALVAPFNAVVVAAVVLLRVPAVRRLLPGQPPALPLASVGRPERALAQWRARARLTALVRDARSVCVLTGAGVSTAAGLPDFRGSFGLGARARRITLSDFVGSPAARQEYWRQEEAFLALLQRAAPAAVHRTLCELHRRGRLSAVVTQNVDGLHQAAGRPDASVIEIHGNLGAARCIDCGLQVPRAQLSPRIAAGDFNLYCPTCQGLLKGGSVMFGERVDPRQLDRALRALLGADLLVVLGTSLLVSPAADMLRWAREAGIPFAIVNATPTPYDRHAAVTVASDVGPVLDDAVALTRA